MGENIYPNPSSLSTGCPEASRKLLRIWKEFTCQDMAIDWYGDKEFLLYSYKCIYICILDR